MGIFSRVAMAAGNLLEIKNLDIGSDMLITTVCNFEPLNVRTEYKKEITNYIKQLFVSNNDVAYTNSEVALIKLVMYCEMSKSHPKIYKELQIGIKKIMQMEENKIPSRTAIKIYTIVKYD